MEFRIMGEPFGKERPRAAHIGNFTKVYTPQKTKDYEEYIKESYLADIKKMPTPTDRYIRMKITALHSIPKGFNKQNKEKALTGELRPSKKPDADNIAKVVMDGLNGFLYKDDTQIIELMVIKKFSETPMVIVEYEFI